MFFLGIMVGRGTSPVTFDTKQFHNRLETIAGEFGKTKIPEEKMDLQFYDALNKPVRQEVKGKKNTPNEIIPKKETGYLLVQMTGPTAVPVKTSRKAATFNKSLVGHIPSRKTASREDGSKHVDPRDTGSKKMDGNIKNEQQPLAKDKTDLSVKKFRKVPPKKMIEKKVSKIDRLPEKQRVSARLSPAETSLVKASGGPEAVVPGMYTIQIAAYKSFKDAVTQMARLEKKGFASYRTLGKKEGVTWYRVRVGGFETRAAASRYIEKLKQAKIDGMIIKKE